MTKSYEDFEDDEHEGDEDEDEDIGALGSILSWDEDEDGGVATTSNSGGESSALPDLVSFNQGSLSALQQLPATGDAQNLSLPIPTAINFGQQQMSGQSDPRSTLPQHKQNTHNVDPSPPQPLTPVSPAQHSNVMSQQQLQQQLQRQHMQQQQQLHQQYQIQQQQPQHQHQSESRSAAASAQQQVQAQVQAAQQAAAQQGAFQLFQQHALLAQTSKQQQPLVPAIMMPGVQQGQDVQSQQFAFASDPAAFLRQLQVAQLQQQFNAVQQSRSLPQQGIQQQIQFPAQVSNVTTGPATAQNQASAPKRSRAASAKKTPPASSATTSRSLAASKAPLVSASDTDCESRHITAGSKMISKVLLSTDDMSESTENKTEVDLSHLSPEEKARANRDRNREHARNTRLRKKAYLEKLKTTVDELCRERDTLVSERAGAATILVEMHNTRTEVLMSFFALRSANEKRRELWASILDESCFACVMPVTPYRSFPASEVQVSKCQRTILGIDGMMSDTSSLHVLLNSLVDRSRFPDATIVFRYTLVTEEAVVAGNQMMARWVMTTLNATQCGARMEVAKQGMLCCKFNSAHKIIGLELMFDVMALMLQLKQAAGSDTFSVIPNTVQTCQRSFDKPMVMTLAEEPYTIVQVNKLWEEMTGYKAEEVVGKASCRLLEGEDTEAAAVESLMSEVRFKRPASAMIIRYKKNGERFQDFFHAYPLSTDSRITHYLFLSSHIQYGPSIVNGAQQSNQGLVQSVGTANAMPQGQPSFYGLSALPSASMNTQPAVAQGTQGMFNVPAVLSNSIVVATPHGAILPQGIEIGNPPQNPHAGGIKRHLSGGENMPASKQIKTMGTPVAGNGTSN
mmetsp:Transcript_89986/g.176174  ORF Transcript_89986/g.176174 Transcript_89986/m.176174 type:complete len:853 (+) Transcript_89986:78-2636(+)